MARAFVASLNSGFIQPGVKQGFCRHPHLYLTQMFLYAIISMTFLYILYILVTQRVSSTESVFMPWNSWIFHSAWFRKKSTFDATTPQMCMSRPKCSIYILTFLFFLFRRNIPLKRHFNDSSFYIYRESSVCNNILTFSLELYCRLLM